MIYTKALHDLRAAAQEWEAAGEFDKAEKVFLDLGDFLAAGDLLQRAGDSDGALKHYRQAAGKLAAAHKYLEAGELLRDRAKRIDLAFLEMYRHGWQTRPNVTALPCGRQPSALHFAQRGRPGAAARPGQGDGRPS